MSVLLLMSGIKQEPCQVDQISAKYYNYMKY